MTSRFKERWWSKSKSSRLLRAGNRAARMRISPPLDWRAATSRSRQAARNSSWVQLSARARSREPLDRRGQRRGLQRPAQVGEVGWSPWGVPSRHPGRSVVDGEVPHLDLVAVGAVGEGAGPAELAGRSWSGSVMVRCFAHDRGWRATTSPAQVTTTSSRSTRTSTRRPIALGCTE